MDISWETTQLLAYTQDLRGLPEEVLDILQNGQNEEYLDVLSGLALRPEFTATIFTIHTSVFVDICSRWITLPKFDKLAALSALSKVVSLRPHLSAFAKPLLTGHGNAVLELLALRKPTSLQDIPVDALHDVLLAIHRLLAFGNEEFADFVAPAQLQSLLAHESRCIRYLAIRILCSYLHASDAALAEMVKKYLGEEEVQGRWEDKIIDFTFYSLWEERRLKDLRKGLQETDVARNECLQSQDSPQIRRVIQLEDFLATSACIGGVLVPRLVSSGMDNGSIFMTETTSKDMRVLAEGINSGKPLLVSGSGGSGKTSMIRHAARVLGMDSSMITLHLNEQTDAKLLIGMYTSSKNPSSFTWQPGVLTKAVRDGRWVVIEDLDRAPAEILSTILPLLERRELFIPNWGESIRAASGFKLLATVRSSENVRGEEVDHAANIIGRRLWSQIPVGSKSDHELAAIVEYKCPILQAYIPQMMAVYSALRAANFNSRARNSLLKPTSTRDLLRWSARAEALLLAAGIVSSREPISEATSFDIFLEAVDCFAGALPMGPLKMQIIDTIAQQLQVPKQRVEYCLRTRVPVYQASDSLFSIGRSKLFKKKEVSRAAVGNGVTGTGPFAITDHVSRILESVAATVKLAEPCLLVGETGTGKTTIVQKLASALNHRLTVVNLSQQSEAGDLLGGFKPVNVRSLAMPMREEFDELLHLTFPSKTNQQYTNTLEKTIAKGRWSRALSLWQEALRSIQSHFKTVLATPEPGGEEPRSKKRKVRNSTYQQLKSRWDKFATDVQTFQMHLSSGSKGFAFSFVEGSIVKAARNGDWVLLDEINLASPDTLESLADLFCSEQDGNPSVLLSETGDVERIQAHKDFRIFGAMNPATDAGKRDLPPNIRSRFSEFFVEAPDQDLKNLVPVVKAYLGSHDHVDVRLANDVAQLYLEIKILGNANKLADGTDQKAHFSLRTLTRTLTYAIDIAGVYGLRRAIYEGFCMSFLTVLNKGSELLLQPLIDQYTLGSQKNRTAMMHQTPRAPQDGKDYVQFRHYWVSKGPTSIEEQDHYIITPFIERNLLNLVRATSTRRFPVLLQGPTSSGKTSMIEHLAKVSGNKFVRINNHEHTDLQEYLGSYISGPDGRLQYQEGILVQALREGYWIVLDELNLAPTDVLEALNRLLDDNRELFIPETQQVIRPHDSFMLFATQNPPGVYGGRKVLSRAFRNRFLELHFDDIPEDELETILRERSQIAPSFCTRIVAVYNRLSILRQTTRLFEQRNSFATLRDLFRWALRDADDREQLAVNGFLLLAERVRDAEERLAVKKVIEEVMKVKINEEQIYGLDTLEQSLGSPLPTPQGITWTMSMRRLYVLVSQALKNHEPVLLVGETGSGKTTICQAIAETMDIKLHMVNAHQNMETGDLVGAQRPIRDKSSASSHLVHILITSLKESGLGDATPGYNLETLMNQYDRLIHDSPENFSDEIQQKVEKSRTRANALFEWADSSLVQAMRKGEHYLLDEISLADDSVLERLNSVLEPGRSLLLAEKGSSDAYVSSSPDFQFLATMNPGGDYGKRELSPALRNRFTEIWVPNIVDQEEMLEIVQAKLPASRVGLAKSMVNFAAWYSSRYGANAFSISIRDLLAWVKFVDTFRKADPSFSVFHGAAMVYLDRLGANPAAHSSTGNTDGPHEVQVCLQKLSEASGCDMMSASTVTPELSLSSHELQVGQFNLTRTSDKASGFQYSLQAPTTKLNAMKIVRALQLRKPILLEGSPGVGKTTIVSALAHALGTPLTRVNLSDQTDLMDLFGSDVPNEGEGAGQFGWRDAPFLRAMQNGEWVLLDEMNLASQTVLEGLNACLDHRGQVYISELDRTFTRHPDFVVFAAQNPHSQGGGRKGLPASFVNRFTVVYAEAFSPQDLQIICRELYPEVPWKLVEQLVSCVTLLSSFLQRDASLGAHGGPWEVNLRDILRWLQLLTSRDPLLPLANPSDLTNLLFVQRFRSHEDRTSISKILAQFVSRKCPPRSYYHTHSPHTLQVGFGMLAKDQTLQPSLNFLQKGTPMNLSIVESMMLCIQKSWPCLLVGASGSGKTTVIRQLATSVGADMINVSLNSEMDTMDLVGGFEQLDTEREITGFIKRLRVYTLKAIVQQLISAPGINDNVLMRLDGENTTNLPDIMQSLQYAARSYPSSDFPSFLEECEALMQQASIDNRARFEWVDGILVRALKQGKWLVLDNANLCNPSVLDRLNSLLEPNGFLSINEHRNVDGSARIVKPHPSFKLFMTMDPRYGELSRAMRNRSVELFLPVELPSPTTDVFGTNHESTISHFQFFQIFEWEKIDDALFFNMLTVCFDHLASSDFKLYERWQAQATLGLVDVSRSRFSQFQSIMLTYRDLLTSDHECINHIQDAYASMSDELGYGKDLRALQSIHPFNNSIMLSPRNLSSEQLQCLGHCFDLMIELGGFGQKLRRAAQCIGSKTASDMTRLESSLSLDSTRATRNESTRNIANFLQHMGSFFVNVLDNTTIVDSTSSQVSRSALRFKCTSDERNKAFLPFAKEVLAYLVDLFDLSHSHNFDEGVFQTYQGLGRSLVTGTVGSERSSGPRAKLEQELSAQLENFSTAWTLYSGLAMEELWSTLKPPTATSLVQLDICLEIEALADRFDTLKWRSGASLRELGILRDSIIAVYAAVDTRQFQFTTALENVKKALEEVERHSLAYGDHAVPFFKDQFKILFQIQCLGDVSKFQESLEILSGRPIKASMRLGPASEGWATISQVALVKGDGGASSELAAVRQTFPVSTLHKLQGLNEVPLDSLSLLTVEVDRLSQTSARLCSEIANDYAPYIDGLLKKLRATVLQSLGTGNIQKFRPQLDHLSKRLRGISLNQAGLNKGGIKLVGLEKAVDALIDKSHTSVESNERPTRIEMAASWIQFFTGLLLLYISDRPFDPALRPHVERDRHEKRTKELHERLDALQLFEKAFSGQCSSYRTHLVERDLHALGATPQVPMTFRPESSQLSLLQGEFNNILKSVVLPGIDSTTLNAAVGRNSEFKQEVELLRVNIDKAVSRLSNDYRAYDDMVKPAIAMLQGLDIGLGLAILASTEKTGAEETIAHICNTTPFMGATSRSLIDQNFKDLENMGSATFDPRSLFLQRVALARTVGSDLSRASLRTMMETFHSFYREWKEKLDQDQKANAAKSSLYRYRGSEEDNDEMNKEDFKRLFPSYEIDDEKNVSSHKPTQQPKILAQRLSSLHSEIFFRSRSAEDKILSLMKNASDEIARQWPDNSRMSTSPVAPERLLSSLLLNLDQAKESLQSRRQQHNLYNFYEDSNIVESQKLVALVENVQSRFRDLQEAWPEHATLEDVLRVSRELLLLRHSEPVAKLLTKAEQLHGYVHEWQIVASREYTAVNLYDDLTGLLISWRRLELSTWGRLLDMEDSHCKEDSDSWWFIAYEVIIAAPMSMIDGQESIGAYAEQLFSTLETFLATTSWGQYSHRLYMIKCFEDHIALLAKEHEHLGVIQNALGNFLRYYHRYNGSIQESLKKGRQKLEKDMKEILLLASWKDTNIVALRDSAKRSHHKLFKVVRKYRALLAQPAEMVLRQAMTDTQSSGDSPFPTTVAFAVPNADRRAIKLCEDKLSGWKSKPVRLTEPDETARSMLRISHVPPTAIDGAAHLENFTSDLVNSIKVLQKETPTKATKENSEAVKHLKSRKRKLFSETLKALRQMGIRSNLSADVLKKQESVAAVLSSSPIIADAAPQHLAQANHHFDRFLQIIPQTRENATKHSEDLSHGEAARSIGYLESILSVIIEQREILAGSVSDAADFEATCEMMNNLWDPDSYSVRKQNAASAKSEIERREVVKWLPSILDVGCVVLGKCSQLGGTASSESLEALKDWRKEFSVLSMVMNALPTLPSGLSSSSHAHVFGPENTELDKLRDRLETASKEEPNVAFIFSQIKLWLRCLGTEKVQQSKSVETLSALQFDNSVAIAVDSMLVAMQNMGETLRSMPSTNEEGHWLVSLDTCLSNCLRRLHVKEIDGLLQHAMLQMQHLETSDDLMIANAIWGVASPIIQQYQQIQKAVTTRIAVLNLYLCRLASILAKVFSQIALEGFCSPTETSADEDKTTEKLEGGTGLGEGEGVEDISKDIQDDEDLSELAQQGKKEEDKEEIEDQDDAVDMDHDELEGEMGDAPDQSDGDEDSSDGSGANDIDDETGDVDDLDPGAVDEKLWDGRGDDADKDKEGENKKGEADKDKSAAAEKEKKNGDNGEDGEEEAVEDENVSEDGADEGEEIAREKNEKMDPQVQEAQNLDLPEEIDLGDADGSQVSQSLDSDMDGLSDIDAQEDEERNPAPEDDDLDAESLNDEDEDKPKPRDGEDLDDQDETAEDGSRAGSPVDTEPEDNDLDDKEGQLQKRTDDAAIDEANAAPSDAQGLGQDEDLVQDEEQTQENEVRGSKGAKGAPSGMDDDQAAAEDGEMSKNPANTEAGRGQDDISRQEQGSQAFKKLGDALEEWHKQQKSIQEASNPKWKHQPPPQKQKTAGEDFEHLGSEDEEADTQALGAASKEQARPLDDTAVDSEIQDVPQTFAPENANEEGVTEEDQAMEDAEDALNRPDYSREQPRPGAFVGNDVRPERQMGQQNAISHEYEERLDDLDTELSVTHLETNDEASKKSMDEARHLWAHYEAITRDLSLFLTERLRLILAPTLATKMRGDFRTGKRLNIKRIIPYIASNFKRDKIWMRRSIPSKRKYQILLAVDDSKSMSESGSGQLAYQTLALIARSLSMLEVGELCIVGFGSHVFVAHEFETPFSSEAGASVIQRFGFQQNFTDVRRLVAESTRLFQKARLRQSSSVTDLWQLELIISDGVCEDHETIKTLVRQASEERIMMVFVIVDALHKEESIMDMSEARFETDPTTGESRLNMKRYLENFPFTYYLVVGDVRELPRVLAQALRQWFAEVAESG